MKRIPYAILKALLLLAKLPNTKHLRLVAMGKAIGRRKVEVKP